MYLVLIIIVIAQLADFFVARWQQHRQVVMDAQWKCLASINVPGADHIDANTSVLRQIGLPAEQVLDVCIVKGPLGARDIPPKVLTLLGRLYEKGYALGLETREMAFGHRGLAAGEGLYLISLDARPNLRYLAILARA